MSEPTKPSNTLTDIIGSIDRGQEVEKLADAVTDLILSKHKSIVRTLVWPLVRGEIVTVRRLQAYAGERRIHEGIKTGGWSTIRGAFGFEPKHRVSADPLEPFRDLLGKTVFVPNYGRLLWDDATIDQLEARKEMLEHKASGHLESASLIQEVINTLVANNAKCLGDLRKQSK